MRIYRNALLFLFLLGMIGKASAGGLNAVVVNNTSYTIYAIYASSSDAATWDMSTNLVSGQPIAPGQQVVLNVGTSSSSSTDPCDFDLAAELDGSSQFAYQYSLNACNGATWTITGS
jgi:hypothetical protein